MLLFFKAVLILFTNKSEHGFINKFSLKNCCSEYSVLFRDFLHNFLSFNNQIKEMQI